MNNYEEKNKKMRKKEKKKSLSTGKKVAIGISSVLAGAVIFAGAHLIAYSIKTPNVYYGNLYDSPSQVYEYFDEKPHTDLCFELSDEEFEKISDRYIKKSEDEMKRGIYDDVTPVTEEMQKVLDVANKMIIDYFNDKYGVSVEGELKELKAMTLDTLLKKTDAGGVYFTPGEEGFDGKTIVLDTYFFEDAYDEESGKYSKDMASQLYEVYIHEALHYLGTSSVYNSDSIEMMYPYEGLTVSLAMDIMEYGGMDAYDNSAYFMLTDLADQILIADKDLATKMIDGTGYMTTEELCNHFDSNSFEGMGEALKKAFTILMEDDSDENQIMAQHIVGEYVKHFELTPEEQIEIADNFIRPVSAV